MEEKQTLNESIHQYFVEANRAEDLSLRDANIKHFDLGLNRHQAIIYPAAVHFRNDRNEWQEIDNTLEETETDDGRKVLRNRANRVRMELPRETDNGSIVSISDEAHTFSWRFEKTPFPVPAKAQAGADIKRRELADKAQRLPKYAGRTYESLLNADLEKEMETEQERSADVVNLRAQCRYDDLLPGLSAQYTLNGEMIKENIILADASALSNAAIRLEKNYLYTVSEDQRLRVLDKDTGEERFRVSAPVVIDAEGKETMAKVVLTDLDEYICLEYLIEPDFLANAIYPIIIDPVVMTSTQSANVADAYIWAANPGTNYGQVYIMRCGDGSGGESLSLIKFNKLTKLRASDTIISAQLRVHAQNYGSDNEIMGCYPIKNAWGENTVTWNSMTPNNDNHISSDLIAYVTKTSSTYCYFNITPLYRKWYLNDSTGHTQNFGVALRRPPEVTTGGNYVEWSSTQYDNAKGPCMVVNYVSHAGRQSWWPYESMSAERAGAAYVDLFNGNMVYEHADGSTTGNRMPVALTHVYNSCLSSSNPVGCGLGWRTSMHQSVRYVTLNSINYYVWTDGSATEHYFPATGSQPYSDMEGMELKLTISGSELTITDKSNTVMTFPKPGNATERYLTRIADACGNKVELTYDENNHLSMIKDDLDRQITFVYTDGLLTSLLIPGCPSLTFTYSDAHLTEIHYSNVPDGCTSFQYTSGGNLLETARNFDGVAVNMQYESAASYDSAAIQDYAAQVRRVISMERVNGPALGARQLFDYRHMTTKVTAVQSATSDEGKVITYQFNDNGNVVCSFDELGFAVSSAYSATVPNQQTNVSRLKKAVINLLTNLDFSSGWTFSPASANDTVAASSSTRCLGLPTLKIIKSASAESFASASVTIPEAGVYTFSAYVKNDAELGENGLFLRIRSGENVYASRAVTHPTLSLNAANAADGWERLYISADLPAGDISVELVSAASSGTARFGCPQLELGSIANHVNLLVNSDFTRTVTNSGRPFPQYWTPKSGITGSALNGIVTDPGLPSGLSGNAMRVLATPNGTNQSVMQAVNVSGKANDVFVLGGWANTQSVQSGAANFEPKLLIKFINSSTSSGQFKKFSTAWVGWQYGSWVAIAPIDYTSVQLYFCYEHNAQTGMFTNLYLYREEFGQSYTYDSNNNITSVAGMTTQKSDMQYDSYNNLTSYRQPGAPSSAKYLMTYGSSNEEKKRHLLLTETSPMGIKNTYTYDQYGNRLTAVNQKTADDPLMKSETSYTDDGNYAHEFTDARGNVVSQDVDTTTGTITSVTDPAGHTVNYTYDDDKRVTSVRAESGDMVYRNAYTYEDDRLKTVAHNTTANDVNDVVYTIDHDALGRQTTVSVGDQPLSTNVYEDNRTGLLKEVNYGNGGKVAYTYDDFDRLTGITYDDATDPRFTYEYSASGNAQIVKDHDLQREFQTENDVSMRPVSTQLRDENGEILYRTLVSYDQQNRVTKFAEVTPADQHTTEYTYDNDNRPTEIKYDNSETNKVTYEYDTLGRVSSRDIAGYTSSFEFVSGSPAFGENATSPLVKKISQGNDENAMDFEYAYDNRGNIISEKRNGIITTYEYDAIGQLVRVNDPHENATWVYTYDRGGNILNKARYTYSTGELGEAVENIPYLYEDTNWKDKLTSYNGTPIWYDEIGNPLRFGNMRFNWEEGRRLKSIQMNSGLKARSMSGWDRDSNTLLRIVFENGNSFENQGEVVTASAQVFQDGVNVTEDYPASGFSWTINTEHPAADAAWNAAHAGMKSVTLAVANVPDTAKLNCSLTSVASTYGTVQVDVDTMIASCTPGTSTSTLSYSNGLLSATVEDGENPYTLIAGVLYGKQYLDGTITASAWVFPHVSFDRTVEYQYNHAGLRVQKIFTAGNDVTTTKYTLNGANVVDMTVTNAISDEIVSTDTMHFFYDASNQPAMVNFNGAMYTYVKNLQNDIVGMLDSDGTLVVKYHYDAWGKLLYMYGNTIADEIMGQLNPFRYRGYVYDEETELYYLRSRYYNPTWGRFINADVLLGQVGTLLGHNVFAYCGNEPITGVDENGKYSHWLRNALENEVLYNAYWNLSIVTQLKHTGLGAFGALWTLAEH